MLGQTSNQCKLKTKATFRGFLALDLGLGASFGAFSFFGAASLAAFSFTGFATAFFAAGFLVVEAFLVVSFVVDF